VIFSPSFVFGLLLATFYGALAHLIFGGGGRSLLFYILAAWVGFSIGHAVGQVMGIRLLSVGPVNVLTGTLGALIAVVTTAILSSRRVNNQQG
jgi:uncharacterized membrane protein YeaQ/YmgE (transglycosylase-associated protein family)